MPSARPAARLPGRWPGWRRRLAATGLTIGLAAAGLWLGGYPGSVILPAATALFLLAGRLASLPAAAGRESARYWRAVGEPWVLAVLLVAAAACDAAGERLLLSGEPGSIATGLWNTVPQVICLIVAGRLAAALIRPGQSCCDPLPRS
jgi:hypothetical protein